MTEKKWYDTLVTECTLNKCLGDLGAAQSNLTELEGRKLKELELVARYEVERAKLMIPYFNIEQAISSNADEPQPSSDGHLGVPMPSSVDDISVKEGGGWQLVEGVL
jgi:hypothetical protein